MKLLRYSPAEPLAQFIELFWLCERDALKHSRELALPTGTVELVIGLEEGGFNATVCGPHSVPFEIDTATPALLLGVHFRPGGASPFFRLPIGELQNQHVSLDTLWGKKAEHLRERAMESKMPAEKFRLLEQALIGQARQPSARRSAVTLALDRFHSQTEEWAVSDVVEETGWSARRFIQVFRDEVGLTPKLYHRVHRFQKVLQHVHRSSRVDWTNVALHCGYYDQAHFIHDFNEFSGLNPSAYLRVRGEHMNHVPVQD